MYNMSLKDFARLSQFFEEHWCRAWICLPFLFVIQAKVRRGYFANIKEQK